MPAYPVATPPPPFGAAPHPADVPPPVFAPAAYDYAPPSQPNRTPLLVGVIAVAALVVAGLAWWAFSDIQMNGPQPKAKGGSPVAGTPLEAGPLAADAPPYADVFLTTADETMTTRGPVALLPQPTQSGAVPLRSMPEGAPITGRWVRGADGVSRWFRLSSGGYLPEAAVVAAVRVPERVRAFDFSAAFGSALGGYFEQAGSEHQRAMEIAAKKGEDEVQVSGFARVPSRSLYGVTVVAVGSHYEASSVIFRESAPVVRAALRAAGWQVANDGTLTVGSDDPVSCSVNSTTQWADFAAYGPTVLSCGV